MQFVSDVYFENNGEIDLLTGAMAPERFNQILALYLWLKPSGVLRRKVRL